MTEPSVKGAMLVGSVILTRQLRDRAVFGQDLLEQSLAFETRALLDTRIQIAKWYPMWQFNELLELSWVELAKCDPKYARQEGVRSFARMEQTGRYEQIDFAKRAAKATSKSDMLRQTRIITSMTASYYNFLEVEVRLDPDSDDLQILYGNAELFCEPLRYNTEGFMTGVGNSRGTYTAWTSERVTPDQIIFTLPRE